LLQHYHIKTPVKSYHDFNKEKVAPSFINNLKDGFSLALISDAGTPGISDPGFYLARMAIAEGINVEAIPGATSFVAALITSGMPTDRFVFEGFLPVKKGRHKRLEQLKDEQRTIILFESPKRLARTLQDLRQALGERQAVAAREITKKFEQIIRGSFTEIITYFEENSPKGEFVLIVHGNLKKKLDKEQ
jgi:16S rRNA (cytidine1402-2'-O)-methyltransferase